MKKFEKKENICNLISTLWPHKFCLLHSLSTFIIMFISKFYYAFSENKTNVILACLLYAQDIPQELWYLYVALHQRPRYLMQLVRDEIDRENKHFLRRSGGMLSFNIITR